LRGKNSPSNKNDRVAFSYRCLHQAAYVRGKTLCFRDGRFLQDINFPEYILEKININFVSGVPAII